MSEKATRRFRVTAEVWRHPGEGGWHFVTLPADLADELHVRAAGARRPFGSIPVAVTLGSSAWSTSAFRDTKLDSYVLPLKADVRRRERIGHGDSVRLEIELRS